MLAGLPDVSAHFARFPVREISLRAGRARPVRDRADPRRGRAAGRCEGRLDRLERHVGRLARLRDRRGLVPRDRDRDRDPGRHLGAGAERDLRAHRRAALRPGHALSAPRSRQRIVANYAQAGFACAAERHLGDPGNFSFADYDEELIAGMIREVAAARPDAITVFCTNFRGARVAPALEAETGHPDLRHGRHCGLARPQARRRRSRPHPRLRPPVPRARLRPAAAERCARATLAALPPAAIVASTVTAHAQILGGGRSRCTIW